MQQEDVGLRKAPQQARSQQRVDAILSAAGEMIGETGYEGVTTSKLAKRAGISVGSFYQYFADKEAVFQALGDRYLVEMRRKIDAMFPPDAQYAPLEVLVGRSVDMLVIHAAEHNQLVELMESAWVSPEMRAMTVAMNEEIERKIGEILAHRTPHLEEGERRIAAVVMMNLVKAVLPAIEGRNEPQRSIIVEEFKRLGVFYMQSVIRQERRPQGP
ncbi:MAG: TetR/AcrR family transcriptional regulator [Caldilineaceae bacterium]